MNDIGRLFHEELAKIPLETKMRVDWSFAIADKIDALLKEQGMTQRELAKKMGKRENEVSRWLSGQHNFTISTLAKISAILGKELIAVE